MQKIINCLRRKSRGLLCELQLWVWKRSLQRTKKKGKLQEEQILSQGAYKNEGMQYLSSKCELRACDLFSLVKQSPRADNIAVYKTFQRGV